MKKLKAILRLIISMMLSITLILLCACNGNTKISNKMRDITTMDLVADMGLGINLGNTMEACGISGDNVTHYETSWGSPVVTEDMVAGYKECGFNSVRIPVAWSNLMEDDYTISVELMNRVEEIVNYVIDNDMYAIVNIHWDGGWFEGFSTDYDTCIQKYTRIWEQISERFKDYNDYLIFESLNEEGYYEDIWNRYSGSDDGKQEAYDILNNINQTFVDIVRNSGSNNAERHLLIAGYATDITLTCDDYFKMPNDSINRCAVSVHYYNPPTFCILKQDASWGKARTDWGTQADLDELNNYMDMMKTNFVDKGIPVIVGEYGCVTENKSDEVVRTFLTSVCEAIYSRGMCPMLWSTPGSFYDRENYTFYDGELLSQFQNIANTARS